MDEFDVVRCDISTPGAAKKIGWLDASAGSPGSPMTLR